MEHVVHGEGQSKLVFCGCGRFHFTYGPLTLHFDPDEFLRFTKSVERLSVLARQTPQTESTMTKRAPNTDRCH